MMQLKLMVISLLATASAVTLDPCSSEAATRSGTKRPISWPGGIVPYMMNPYLPENIHLAVIRQMKNWELSTCIRFIPRTTHWDHFVYFRPGERNCALFGLLGLGLHEVSLSPSVSTNITALNVIFTKMLGISNNPEITSSKRLKKILSNYHNPDNAVELNISANKSVVITCQESCGYSTVIKNDSMNPYIITSPGYPNFYEANVDCVWSIYNTNGKSLSISFIDVDIEENIYCTYDYIEVIEVNATGTIKRFKLLCKNSNDLLTVHNGSKLSIRFHSDSSENGKGFKAHILQEQPPHCNLNNGGCTHTCIPIGATRMCQCNEGYELLDDGVSCGDIDECKTENVSCAQQCVNTNGSYHCKCHLGYSRNPDNITCERCYETYTNRQIVIISSPGYPGVYTPFHNCVWKITTSKPQFYQIEINSFSLNYSPNCKLDYLKISDRANKLTLPNNGRLCGLHSKISIVSRTSQLTVCFRSSSQSQGGTGFQLVYWQLAEKKRRYVKIDDTKI